MLLLLNPALFDSPFEPTLAGSMDYLRERIGFTAQYGSDPAGWTANEAKHVEWCLDDGLRQFLHTTAVAPGQTIAHSWSFLRPTGNIVTSAPAVINIWNTLAGGASTATVKLASGVLTLIVTGGSNAGTQTFTLASYSTIAALAAAVDGGYGWFCRVMSRGDEATSTMQNLATTTATASVLLYGTRPYIYDLPDDFAYMLGPITFAENKVYGPIDLINEAQIRNYRALSSSPGVPCRAAIRPKPSTGLSGQRSELLLDPPPSSDWVLTFRYGWLANALTSERPYPLGGEAHFATILESCLAMVEQNLFEQPGIHTARYENLLRASIAQDIRAGAAETLGIMLDPGRKGQRNPRDLVNVTFNGILYGT